MKKKVAFIYGTRPEVVKISPVIRALKPYDNLDIRLINTGQHLQIAEDSLLELASDINLGIMAPKSTLNTIFASVIQKLEPILEEDKPDLIIVQGDTTTATASAICASNLETPVAHVEAGLRTHNHNSPFPEEINRILISQLSKYHFCPTKQNKENLFIENITRNVWVTGSTALDAVDRVIEGLGKREEIKKLYITFTMHRRENIKYKRIYRYFLELLNFLKIHDEFHCLLPLHPNPEVGRQVQEALHHCEASHKVTIQSPLPYHKFVKQCMNSWFVCSDSGGIQEEITRIKRPLFVLRDTTEREEVLKFPGTKLCEDPQSFRRELASFYTVHHEERYQRSLNATIDSPFGDGRSGQRIADILYRKIIFKENSCAQQV